MKKHMFSILAGLMIVLLFSGCGGTPERHDNSADVLARIEAGATPLAPPPTVPEQTSAPEPEAGTETLPAASPTPLIEHPSLTAEQWSQMLEKLDRQIKQMVFDGERFTILQQGDTVLDERWYISYRVMLQKENYPANTNILDYFIDMETEQIYLRVGEKLYSQNTVSACMDKIRGILTKEEQTCILCQFDGEKEHLGEKYFVMHAFTCSPVMEEGNGISYTYGWYYIKADTMAVYKWNAAEDTLSKA